MRAHRLILVPLSLALAWGGVAWHARRDRQDAQQFQADLLAQGLEDFRARTGRLPCPAADGEGREACLGEGMMLEGMVPWRALGLHRASVNASLRLRVARVYTQPRLLDRLPVDALCRSGLFPDLPLADEMAAQIVAANHPVKPLVALRRWQLRPHGESGSPPHLYAEAERAGDMLSLRWGTLCGGEWFAQRNTRFALPRPWPARRPVEWAASRQGQRGAFWEPGTGHPLFVERTGAVWKAVDMLSKETLDTLVPRQLAWSGDGRWLAMLTEESEPRLWDCRSLPCQRTDFGLPEERLAAAATARSIAFGASDALILATAQAPHLLIGQRRAERWEWLPTEHWNIASPPRLARLGADGHHAVWEEEGHLGIAGWLSQPEEAFLSTLSLPHADSPRWWALSPDARWLAILEGSDAAFYARDGARWYERARQPVAKPSETLALQWEDPATLLVLSLSSQSSIHAPDLP